MSETTIIVDEILLVRNPIPIPALKHINTYIISSNDCTMVIDPGMAEDSARALQNTLRSKGLKEPSIIVATHFHVDHSTAAAFLNGNPLLMMGRDDWKWIEYMVAEWPRPAKEVEELYAEHGMPREEAEQLTRKHPAFSRIKLFEKLVEKYRPRILVDGDIVKACEKMYRVVWVPGHTPGHIALLEEEKKYVFIGDHILADITPNIPMIIWELNPLRDYLASLDKIEELNPKLLLPGHRKLIEEPKTRIKELRTHHRRRLCELIAIVLSSPGISVYEAASKMTWDVPFKDWSMFPLSQKYFAHAEALSHAKYLITEGVIEAREKDGVYRLKIVDEEKARQLCSFPKS